MNWLNENAGALTAIGTIALAVAAVVTGVIAIRALRATQSDSADRARPYLTAELAQDSAAISLVLSNHGATAARDLTVTFDPPIPADLPKGSLGPFVRDRYSTPVATLAPGQALRNVWWTDAPGPGGGFRNVEGLPDAFVVGLEYSGRGRDPYRDTFRLDVKQALAETGRSSDSRSESIATGISGIEQNLRRMTASQSRDIRHQLQRPVMPSAAVDPPADPTPPPCPTRGP